MSDRFPCLKLFLFAVLTLALPAMPQDLRAAGATGQLEAMTGSKIGRFTYHPMSKTATPRMPASVGGVMMMSSLMGTVMQGMMNAAIDARVRAQRQAQYQEMQQWLAQEQQRLSEMVARQRAKRDLESKAGLEEMAQVLSDQFDTGKKPLDLAGALEDPRVVDLRSRTDVPPEGDPEVVDLRDRTRDIPQIPGGKKPRPAKTAYQPPSQPESLKKLQQMIQENQDPAKLDKNLKKLEDRLAEVQRQSGQLAEKPHLSRKEFAEWDRTVGQAAQEGMQRGLSLAMDPGSRLGGDKSDLAALLKDQKANPGQWQKTLERMGHINDFAEFSEKGLTGKNREQLGQLDWGQCRKNLMADLDALPEPLKSPGPQYQSGKTMIDKSLEMAQTREEACRAAQGEGKLTPFFWDKKKKIEAAGAELADLTQKMRRDLALKQPGGQRELAKAAPAKIPGGPEAPERRAPVSGGPPSPEVKKELDLLIKTDLNRRGQTMEKMAQALHRFPAPPPPVTEYKTILFMGTGNSQEDADAYLRKHFRNPLTGEVYEQIYAFGQHGVGKDLLRVIFDHVLAEKDFLAPSTFEKCARLKEVRINHLVAHSNGATVAEVLIKNNFIKVRELTLLGGDRTLTNLPALEKLAKDKGIERINVFVNQGDTIPLLPQASQTPIMQDIMLSQRVTLPPSGFSRVKVVVFDKGPYVYGSYAPVSQKELSNQSNFTYHFIDNYHNNVRRYRASLKQP